MTSIQKSPEVVRIPNHVTMESFAHRLIQARTQTPGQILFSSPQGDRFMYEDKEVELLAAMRLLDFGVMDAQEKAKEAGEVTMLAADLHEVSEPDIEGNRTVRDVRDLGGGYGVSFEFTLFQPPATDTETLAYVNRLVVETVDLRQIPAAA